MDYNNWKTLKPIQTPAGMYGDTHDPFSDHSEMGFEKFIIFTNDSTFYNYDEKNPQSPNTK